MDKYIKLEPIMNIALEQSSEWLYDAILEIPWVEDVVPKNAYEQVRWERDICLEQLEIIGKGLGEKMDDVSKVVRCYECIFADELAGDSCICENTGLGMSKYGFCSNGVREEHPGNG